MSYYKSTDSIMSTPLLIISSKPNYIPKVPSPNTIIVGLGLQYVNLGGGTNMSSTVLLNDLN